MDLISEESPEEPQIDRSQDVLPIKETKIAELDMSEIENENHPGHPSAFACPDCGGVLWEIEDGGFLRFRCRVGHAFTMASLGGEQDQAVENALWVAMRALDEKAALNKRLADSSSDIRMAARLREQAEDDHANANLIRNLIFAENKELKPTG